MNAAVWITIALLLLNAFFVGAEFAAMAARRSQMEPLAAQGNRRAAIVLQAFERMGSMLACAQLGITVCSVLLGAISEEALHHVLLAPVEALGLSPAWADGLALAGALLVIVYLHVVVGEMIPKNLAIAGPDRSALLLVPPLFYLTRALRPVIVVMEYIAKRIVRSLGIEPRDEAASEFTAEEMAHIVDESRREGLVAFEDAARLGAALEFSDKDAGDVGVPLATLVTVAATATPHEIERLVAKHGFSRFPVAGEGGALVGYVHLKDLLYAVGERRDLPIEPARIRSMTTVSAGDEVEEVLQRMQASRTHLAKVLGADGEVVAVVFLEDVIEELVGEVTDSSQRRR